MPLIVILTCLSALAGASIATARPRPRPIVKPRPPSTSTTSGDTADETANESSDDDLRRPGPPSLSGETAPVDDATSSESQPSSEPSSAPSSAPASAPTSGPSTAPSSQPGNTPEANLDFDLLGPSTKTRTTDAATASRIAEKAHTRRKMLHWHQGLGIGMLATMVLTTVLGQLNYYDLYGGGSGSGAYLWPHRIGVALTTLSFATTGILALAAPEPYEKQHQGIDSAMIHKISMAAATAGMVTQLVLGFFTARKADAGNGDGLSSMARAHLGVGYATLAFTTIGALSYVF